MGEASFDRLRMSGRGAEPGQVLVSRVVHDLCAGKGFVFTDQGEATLKGFPEPLRLFVVGEGQ